MIVFLTTRGHDYCVRTLVDREFPDLPDCSHISYEDLFLATAIPRATYIFCDIERLAPWETRIAAERYRAMGKAGLRVLNDPARVMCRRELLRSLYRAGINPFNVYPADLKPQPERFPVFIRAEAEHRRIDSELIPDQAKLDGKLRMLRRRGRPLRDLLVVEFAAEPIARGAWRRVGTFRIGDGMSVDSCAIQDDWRVSDGTKGLATEQMFRDEAEEIRTNRLAEAVRPAFEIAGIEWGRADHATYRGREIVFEINTNPRIGPIAGQRLPIREEALAFARARMAALLRAVDTAETGTVPLEPPRALQRLQVVETRTILRP
jgi:hypothetical protein